MTEISREYAEALFLLACENKCADEYGKALELIKSVFGENPEYTVFLASRSIPLSERIQALDEAFSGRVP